MTDLHGWITQQIERAEATARAAEKEDGRTWTSHWDEQADAFQIRDGLGILVADQLQPSAAALVTAHDPGAVLRRCAADRKILDDHTVFGDNSVHCIGCGVDYESGPLVENVNDCPTLLALAEGYGITPEILAELDRPQAPEPKRRGPDPDTSRVPAALRGPNWKG